MAWAPLWTISTQVSSRIISYDPSLKMIKKNVRFAVPHSSDTSNNRPPLQEPDRVENGVVMPYMGMNVLIFAF